MQQPLHASMRALDASGKACPAQRKRENKMAAPADGPFLLYHIQNERGDDPQHPNASRLFPSTPGKVTLAEVLAAFPYTGTGAFHFRFQAMLDKQPVFLDMPPPGAGAASPEACPVPTMGGNVVCKVLRLNALTSSSGRAAHEGGALRVREGGGALRQRPSATGSGGGGRAAPSPREAAPSPQPPLPSRIPAMPTMAASGAVGAHHDVPKEVDGETHIRDTGVAHDLYAKLKQVDERGMRPVRAVADAAEPLPVPEHVDADLEGKSDYVKAAVMARRNEARAKEEAGRVARAAAEASAASEDAELANARIKHEARIKDWGHEAGGALRPLRVLLASLPSALWEGAKWEPAPMAKLVVPSRVKIYYLKAVTVVHPDKTSGLGVEKGYVAGQIFHKLEEAWRLFQEQELS